MFLYGLDDAGQVPEIAGLVNLVRAKLMKLQHQLLGILKILSLSFTGLLRTGMFRLIKRFSERKDLGLLVGAQQGVEKYKWVVICFPDALLTHFAELLGRGSIGMGEYFDWI
ncbi:hypothetical protein BDV19DRAFT_387102 [Aspergillus venezuelensis]